MLIYFNGLFVLLRIICTYIFSRLEQEVRKNVLENGCNYLGLNIGNSGPSSAGDTVPRTITVWKIFTLDLKCLGLCASPMFHYFRMKYKFTLNGKLCPLSYGPVIYLFTAQIRPCGCHLWFRSGLKLDNKLL